MLERTQRPSEKGIDAQPFIPRIVKKLHFLPSAKFTRSFLILKLNNLRFTAMVLLLHNNTPR